MKKLKTPMIYGLVIALASSVLMLSLIGLNLLGPEAVGLGTDMTGGTLLFLMLYLFLLIGIYFVIKKRKEVLGQRISFKEALVQGIVLSLTTAICSVVFTVIFYEVMYPDYVAEILEALQMQMEQTGVPTDKMLAKLEEKKAYYSTGTQSFFSFVGNLITGVAFSLLLSFFLKSNKKAS